MATPRTTQRDATVTTQARSQSVPPSPRVAVKGGSYTMMLRTLATGDLRVNERQQALAENSTILNNLVITSAPLAALRKETILYYDNSLITRMQAIGNDMALMSKSKDAQKLEVTTIAPLRHDIDRYKEVYDSYVKSTERIFDEANAKLRKVGASDHSPRSVVPILGELERDITNLKKQFDDEIVRNYTSNANLKQRLRSAETQVMRQVVAYKTELVTAGTGTDFLPQFDGK